MKRKTDKLDAIKTENFCAAEDPVKRRENLLANHRSDKGLAFRLYKEISKLKSFFLKKNN